MGRGWEGECQEEVEVGGNKRGHERSIASPINNSVYFSLYTYIDGRIILRWSHYIIMLE